MSITLRQKISIQTENLESATHVLARLSDKLDLNSKNFNYDTSESFLTFANDTKFFKEAALFVKKKNPSGLPKTVFVVGIGGANLATKAIHDALSGYGESIFDSQRKMVFLDSVDTSVSETLLLHIKTLNDQNDFIVIIVSRSGETLETSANAEFLMSHLEKKFGDIRERVVIISNKNSKLAISAGEKNISFIPLPDVFSDRFGAFSPTTVIPLMFYGYLVEDFISGANETFKKFRGLNNNLSFQTSVFMDEKYRQGFNIYDIFFFSSRLETLGKWHRQLVAESLGKEGQGITPTVSIGTTDLHSMLQLVLDGPKNKITSFVSIEPRKEESIGDSKNIDALPTGVTTKSFSEVNQVILESVQESYLEKKLPYFDLVLSDISLRALGEYMAYAMLQTIYLAELWNVNAYNQPAVEEYKKKARETLARE